MRTSLIQYGRAFGKLQTIRGITKYQLSPLEQKAFAGAIVKGLPNTLWRIRRNIFYWLPSKSIELIFLEGDHLLSRQT